MQAEKGAKSVPISEKQETIPEISSGNEDVDQSSTKIIQSFPLEGGHGAQQAALPVWRLMIIIGG
jgi:hypothetical protein